MGHYADLPTPVESRVLKGRGSSKGARLGPCKLSKVYIGALSWLLTVGVVVRWPYTHKRQDKNTTGTGVLSSPENWRQRHLF